MMTLVKGFAEVCCFPLRQQYLDSVGRYHGRCYHKENQQQENQVRHGRHAELGDILTLRFNTPLFFNS